MLSHSLSYLVTKASKASTSQHCDCLGFSNLDLQYALLQRFNEDTCLKYFPWSKNSQFLSMQTLLLTYKSYIFFLKNRPNADKWKFKINMAKLKSWTQRMKISYPNIDDPIVRNLIQLIDCIYCMQNVWDVGPQFQIQNKDYFCIEDGKGSLRWMKSFQGLQVWMKSVLTIFELLSMSNRSNKGAKLSLVPAKSFGFHTRRHRPLALYEYCWTLRKLTYRESVFYLLNPSWSIFHYFHACHVLHKLFSTLGFTRLKVHCLS